MPLFGRLTGPPRPVLTGERVLLRMPAGGDFESWRDLREKSRGFLTPWEPSWAADELSRRAFQARLAHYRRDARSRCGYTFLIFARPGQPLLGGITLGQIRRGVAQSASLGYWMGQDYAGQGLMSEAVRLVTAFAFDVEELHRLEAACLPTNARSAALLLKSGFRREGHLRKYLKIAGQWEDHHLYALIADDWTGRDRSSPSRPPASTTA